MIPVYPIAMVVTVALVWWFLQTSEDIYRILAAGGAMISFIIGFAGAPWPVQIGILFAVFGLEQFYRVDRNRQPFPKERLLSRQSLDSIAK